MPLSEKHEEGVWVSVKFFIINCGVILGKYATMRELTQNIEF